MGPQFFHCGNLVKTVKIGKMLTGFNGAAVLSLRKCLVLPPGTPRIDPLQWGRSSFTAEMPAVAARLSRRPELQWGRSSFTAEIISHLKGFNMASFGFNGAAVLSLRKLAAIRGA